MELDSSCRIAPQDIHDILDRALNGGGLSCPEALRLLQARDPGLREEVFAAARELRRRHFGNGVFLYGFLYASTFCRNDCRFCFYRRSSQSCRRYRREPEELLAAAGGLAAQGVHLLDLTMGEDPYFVEEPGLGRLTGLVRNLHEETGLPLMVSPGVVPPAELGALREAGARWYALYQETHNRRLFARLRPGQDYQRRWEAKLEAQRAGLLVEEGVLCGVGEGPQDLARSLEAMRTLDADQVRAMTFVPHPGIPLGGRVPPDPGTELLMIALMRLSFPDRLVPASLDVDGLAGLAARMDAGANVVTSIVPPGLGLAGVAQAERDIEEGRRTIESVLRTLATRGLSAASRGQYAEYLERRPCGSRPAG